MYINIQPILEPLTVEVDKYRSSRFTVMFCSVALDPAIHVDATQHNPSTKDCGLKNSPEPITIEQHELAGLKNDATTLTVICLYWLLLVLEAHVVKHRTGISMQVKLHISSLHVFFVRVFPDITFPAASVHAMPTEVNYCSQKL